MKHLSLLVVGLLMSGCTTDLGRFTAISTKSVNQDTFNSSTNKVKYNVVGKDVSHLIFGMIPTKINPNLGGAVKDALDKAQGDAMINAQAEQTFFFIPLIYGQVAITVKGDVVK